MAGWVIAVAREGRPVRFYTGRRNDKDVPLLAKSYRSALSYICEIAARNDLANARRALPGAVCNVEATP